MKIEKRILTSMNRCYAAAHVEVGGQTRILLATEGEGPCMAWAGPGYDLVTGLGTPNADNLLKDVFLKKRLTQ